MFSHMDTAPSEVRDQAAGRRDLQRTLFVPWTQEDQRHSDQQVHYGRLQFNVTHASGVDSLCLYIGDTGLGRHLNLKRYF